MEEKLALAKQGDITAFNDLFQQYNSALKSYLYRLLTNREDVEDFYHNTFIKAYDKIDTFKGDTSQLRSWIFTIATRLAINHLNSKKRWKTNAQDQCRESLIHDKDAHHRFVSEVNNSPYSYFDLKEHISFCFTCISKTLTVEKQVALLLKNVYNFKVKEVAQIMVKSLGQVKHFLVDARKEMTEIFEGRCALINQNGTCHQCSELQGIYNPKLDFHREAMQLKMVKSAKSHQQEELYNLREELVKQIDPLNSKGRDLHEIFMLHLKKVNNLN
ncbi:MAG: RNA polymerase sigma factor [Chitinophagales bacterium]|nr:RNA polymerase sigma factor [Chitinophagales bacterium]